MDTAATLINLAYIAAAIAFVFGIKMLGHADTARRGNLLSAAGMLLAVIVTLLDRGILRWELILAGLIIGTFIGTIAARRVPMTAMPELVALFNGFGGLASLLVATSELLRRGPGHNHAPILIAVIAFTLIIGGITFSGSVHAWGKLSGKLGSAARIFPGQHLLNITIALALLGCALALTLAGDKHHDYLPVTIIALALILGYLAVMPIGGGDMPVVIALLNSLSGLAASAAGFVINNNVLVVAGCLVGASGFILTIIMCKAMNRNLANVLFSGFGASSTTSQASGPAAEPRPISPEDACLILENARNIVIIPGYGMAVAQAQHVVKELSDLLAEHGAEVRFAIHPVAGRMPGHMNVLLAEADVDYDQLVEMDNINPGMDAVDAAIVIGANDVVNPAAEDTPSSPIYGMPIIRAHRAKITFCMKRGRGTGFSGLENALFTSPNTRMIYGDAKATLTSLATWFKELN